jgi:hypothetical protein
MGYLTVPFKSPMKRITIKILWCDGFGEGGKEFLDVHQLADFLKDNPDFAEPLKYVIKEKKDR